GRRDDGAAANRSQRVARVLPQPVDGRPAPRVAGYLTDVRDIAEFDACRSLGFILRVAGGDSVPDVLFQVAANLLLHVRPAEGTATAPFHDSSSLAGGASTPAIASDMRSHRDRSSRSRRRPRAVSR